MKKLTDSEMMNITGGGINIGLCAMIAAGVTFITGLIDGQIKLKWQKLKNTVFKGNSVEKPSTQIHQEDAIMYIKL